MDPVFTLSRTYTFHYSGPENLPSSVSLVRPVYPDNITEYYFQYNSDGLKTKDSVGFKNMAGESGHWMTNYFYDKDKIYSTPSAKGFSLDNVAFDTMTLKAGNIEMLWHVYKSGTPVKVKYTFSYDHSINPYNRMNIASALYFNILLQAVDIMFPLRHIILA